MSFGAGIPIGWQNRVLRKGLGAERIKEIEAEQDAQFRGFYVDLGKTILEKVKYFSTKYL